MKNHRGSLLGLVAAALTATTITLPAAEAGTPSSPGPGNAFATVHHNPRVVYDAHVYVNPTAEYVAATCNIPLAVPDFTKLTSIKGCGQKVTFTATMQKLSVPASWAGWNSPPKTETSTPDVLYAQESLGMNLHFSKPRKIAGFEIQPIAGEVGSVNVVYNSPAGNTIWGSGMKLTGDNGARLVAAKMGPGLKVDTIWIRSNVEFAIARIRFNP